MKSVNYSKLSVIRSVTTALICISALAAALPLPANKLFQRSIAEDNDRNANAEEFCYNLVESGVTAGDLRLTGQTTALFKISGYNETLEMGMLVIHRHFLFRLKTKL